MWRDYDPRPTEPARPEISRGGRGPGPERSVPPTRARDVFARDLPLPRGPSRRRVRDRTQTYDLRGSEVRLLATVGAFRVVPAGDLQESGGRAIDPWNGDLRRLREAGLGRTVPHLIGRERQTLVTLTERGRDLLEAHRAPTREVRQQTFYAGLVKPRELAHDARLYRAYLHAADRVQTSGGRIHRV